MPAQESSAKHFKSADEFADYQADRELQEALSVASMSPEERFLWSKEKWGRIQDDINSIIGFLDADNEPAARCYYSMEEKNRFDADREIQRAIRIQNKNRPHC